MVLVDPLTWHWTPCWDIIPKTLIQTGLPKRSLNKFQGFLYPEICGKLVIIRSPQDLKSYLLRKKKILIPQQSLILQRRQFWLSTLGRNLSNCCLQVRQDEQNKYADWMVPGSLISGVSGNIQESASAFPFLEHGRYEMWNLNLEKNDACSEVLQVLMVRENHNRMSGPLQQVPTFLQSKLNSQPIAHIINFSLVDSSFREQELQDGEELQAPDVGTKLPLWLLLRHSLPTQMTRPGLGAVALVQK